MSTVDSPWFTVSEAAAYAKVGEDIVTRWIREGRLKPAVTRAKKDLKGRGAAGYLIERGDLDEFLRSLKANIATATLVDAEPKPEPPKPKRAAAAGVESTGEALKRAGF